MSSLYKCVRFFAYILEIITFFIVEQVPNLIPSINNVKPIILLPIAIMIALFEGQKVGLVFGFVENMCPVLLIFAHICLYLCFGISKVWKSACLKD